MQNARRLIHWERNIGAYHELGFQRLVLTNEQMVIALNTFYGTAHFLVTPGVAIFFSPLLTALAWAPANWALNHPALRRRRQDEAS